MAVILTVCMLAAPLSSAQTKRKQAAKKPARTVENVKKDKTNTERKISETSTRLKSNTKELNRQMNRLNSLNADIRSNQSTVDSLRSRIDSLGTQISLTSDSVKMLEAELESMRRAYVKAMRELQPYSGTVSELSFLFSSQSFAEAYNRIRYLRRFSDWRERKVENINKSIDRIAERRARLSRLRNNQDQAYRKAADAQATLSRQQAESEKMVTKLRKEDGALRKMLEEQKRQAKALDRELDRLIAEEQARIAREEEARRKQQAKSPSQKGKVSPIDKSNPAKSTAASAITGTAATATSQLTGSFEANKGRLLFPVAGNYKIVRRFGRQPHPTLPHVEIDNSGIDIEVAKGSNARAVFDGKVSYILKQDGFNSIVMVRHGNYITIYAGLANVNVRQGDNVKAGQSLGSIYSDPEDDNRTKLHFEIRNERQKLNPTQWVR